MNNIELLPFLEKILTANSLTEEIRQTALKFRDEIKYENITTNVFPFNFAHLHVEECDINNCVAKTLYDKKNLKVLGGQVNGLSKIQFAMNLREFYNITIVQAKELAELLESKGAVQFGCDTLKFEGFVYNVDALKECIIKAWHEYPNCIDKTLSKIGLIKIIRGKYGLSLIEAKSLAEYLMDNGMVDNTLNEI